MAVETMKRKLKWLAIVLAVLLLGFGTALFLWSRDRITVESWQKIRIGMTEDEVVEILGGPGIEHQNVQALYSRVVAKSGKDPLDQDSLRTDPNWEFPEVESKVKKVWVGREAISRSNSIKNGM
jgi:hypothetical protein